MAYTIKNTVVNRHENLNYTKWGSLTKPVLAGTGITNWTEDAAPNADEGQYINEKNKHANMTGYAPSVSYTGELIPDNEFIMHIYQVGKMKKVGEEFTAYEVETWAPVDGSEGDYACHVSTYEIQPSNPGSGEGGGKIVLEGKFAQKGDTLHGKFNITTGAFTEGTYDYTNGTFTAKGTAA